ncbi:MAG TPA: hypothetical protein V6C89_13005 [Drouetiella sp.]|jgi:hypothetical protein
MRPETVRDALYILRVSDSFLGEGWHSTDKVLTMHRPFIEEVLRSQPQDIALGVYVNSIERLDCLLITNNGIFSIYDFKGRYIPFESIKSFSTPQMGDQEIDVEMVDNEFETISVLGETNSIPDIHAFYEFLKYLLRDTSSEMFDELTTVESEADLLALMKRHFGSDCANETRLRISSFEDEFKQQDIDPDIMRVKGFWRLIGLWRVDDALLYGPEQDLFFRR